MRRSGQFDSFLRRSLFFYFLFRQSISPLFFFLPGWRRPRQKTPRRSSLGRHSVSLPSADTMAHAGRTGGEFGRELFFFPFCILLRFLFSLLPFSGDLLRSKKERNSRRLPSSCAPLFTSSEKDRLQRVTPLSSFFFMASSNLTSPRRPCESEMEISLSPPPFFPSTFWLFPLLPAGRLSAQIRSRQKPGARLL